MNVTHNREIDKFITTCWVVRSHGEFVAKFPSNEYYINHIFLCVVPGILVISTLALNAVSALTILRCSQLRNKLCYFLILIQSIADLAVGLCGLPLVIFIAASEIAANLDCVLAIVMVKTAFLPSWFAVVTLSAMTFEVYVAILHPYAYSRNIITRTRLSIYFICWILILLIVSGLSYMYYGLALTVACIQGIVFLIFLVYVYSKIYIVVKRVHRTEKSKKPRSNQWKVHTSDVRKRKQFLSEMKQAKSCLIIVGCTVICFLPASLQNLFYVDYRNFEARTFRAWTSILVLANSSLNSIIFFWTKKHLRTEAVRLLKRFLIYGQKQ